MYDYCDGPEYTDDLDFEDDTMECGCASGSCYCEPDLGFGFEHDSAMMSVGWGTDEDYGYYGDE